MRVEKGMLPIKKKNHVTRAMLLFLGLYHHTILTYNDTMKQDFRIHYGKRRKCWKQAFSHFPKMFSILSKQETVSFETLNLIPANDLNLVQSKMLSFGKELKRF